MNGLGIIAGDAMIPIRVWTGALVAVALMALAWWRRERRMRAEQARQRTLHSLAEDVINAPTPAMIAEKLATVLPTVTQASSVNVFLYQRRTRSLERIPTSAEPEPMAASVDSPPEGLANAAVVCFRNRTLLQIPDVRRNPLVKVGPKMSLPRSAMFVPLFSQQEVLGVLELGNSRKTGFFPAEEQADVQHLANQAAAALRLHDRHAMREQLFHSEKLAATGQLISGVASELRTPIENIVNLAATLAAHAADPPSARDLLRLSSESQRASEIVARLVSFGREDDPPSGALVNINELAAELIHFREPEWKSLGLSAQHRLSNDPAPVTGFRSQIEQALLNLIVHAEHRAARSPARTLSIQSSVMARKVLIEITYSSSGEEEREDPFSSANVLEGGSLGLNVCQGIIRSHGGEIRYRSRGASANFEIELPQASAEAEAPAADQRRPPRPLTVMLIEPDPAGQRSLLGLLAARGHRGVPVAPKEAVDLVARLRFDAVFWSLHPASRNWTESYDVLRAHSPVFILVSDAWDADLARRLEQNRDYLLSRPIQDAELDRILAGTGDKSRPAAVK